MKKNDRALWIDGVKGMGILLMILGHMQVGDGIRSFIYSFHMPMFVIISGYLFHNNKDLRTVAGRKMKALLIPYACFHLCALFIRLVLLRLTGYFSWEGAFGITKMQIMVMLGGNSFYKGMLTWIETTGPMWFIPFLFCINMLYCLFAKLEEGRKIHHKWIVPVFFFALSFLGKGIGENIAFLPWSLDCVLVGLLFFYTGVWIKKWDLLNRRTPLWIWLMLTIFWLVSYSSIGGIAFATREYNCYPLCMVVAVAGSLSLMKGIKEAYGHGIGKRVIRGLGWIGRNAMLLLIVHSLDFIYINQIESIQSRNWGRAVSYLIYLAYLLLWVMGIKAVRFIIRRILK